MASLRLRVHSAALANNPLGDPATRDLWLIVPDDLSPGERVPCVWYLAGYAGVGGKMLAHDPWEEGLEERVDRLRREAKIDKLIVALPDAFTRWGGSQYLSSSAHGDYERYLTQELVAEVEARYAISTHAVCGKSSGGYGALALAMRHPGRYSAVACHSGDMGFRLAYAADLAALLNAIDRHGSLEALAAAFDRAPKKKEGRWFGPISVLALCAAYSPDPSRPLGVALPFDPKTGELDDAVLARWSALDPVRMIDAPAARDALRALRLLFIDCGSKDEHQLHWGARQLTAKLRAYGVAHEHEEFDDGHRSTSYRLDVSLPKLSAALRGA